MHSDPKTSFAPPVRTSKLRFSSWCRKLNPNIVHRRKRATAAVAGRQSAASAKTKRAREFDAGRACAAEALFEFGIVTPVASNPDRSPRWPEGTVGSISHSENWTWSAVARQSHLQSIGIDTEPIVSEATRVQLQSEIANDREWQIARQAKLSLEQTFTLVFSAKEAFYKCWYPVRKEFFGFHDTVVEFATEDRVRIGLSASNPNFGFDPTFLDVFYQFEVDSVFTMTWMPQE